MGQAVEDSLVNGYEPLIGGLELPDPNDRHVLAAVIPAGVQLIVTFNRKDFPADKLEPYDVEAVVLDQLIVGQMELNEGAVIEAFQKHAGCPQTTSEVAQ